MQAIKFNKYIPIASFYPLLYKNIDLNNKIYFKKCFLLNILCNTNYFLSEDIN